MFHVNIDSERSTGGSVNFVVGLQSARGGRSIWNDVVKQGVLQKLWIRCQGCNCCRRQVGEGSIRRSKDGGWFNASQVVRPFACKSPARSPRMTCGSNAQIASENWIALI